MKNRLRINSLLYLIAVLTIFVTTQQTLAASHKKTVQNASLPSNPSLYILPNQALQVEQIGTAIDDLLAQNGDSDNVILYVHGRSGGEESEPGKSLTKVMPSLTKNYNAKVIMFYWPGSGDGGAKGFPKNRSQEASPALAQTLMALQQYKQANRDKLKDIKFTLILHSMGNIVFEHYMRSYVQETLEKNLFDTVILNSSATATKDHDFWLKKVDFTPHLYVTVNDDDKVLILAGIHEHAVRLGKSLRSEPLASNAIYVDVTRTGVNHQYFIYSHQNNNPYLRQFYGSVMNGNNFNFEGFNGIKTVEHRDGAPIYEFKGK